MSYKYFPLAIFWYSVAVMPIYNWAKIHSLSSNNKLFREMRFLDLADFCLILCFFERIEVCAFISRKLNKRRGLFFTFPDNFTSSILIAKIYPTWGQGSGVTAPPIGLRSQNFKIDTFSRGFCDQTVRPRGSLLVLFCAPVCPLVNALTSF